MVRSRAMPRLRGRPLCQEVVRERACPQSTRGGAVTGGWVCRPRTPSQVRGPGLVPRVPGPWSLTCEVGTGWVTGKGCGEGSIR